MTTTPKRSGGLANGETSEGEPTPRTREIAWPTLSTAGTRKAELRYAIERSYAIERGAGSKRLK